MPNPFTNMSAADVMQTNVVTVEASDSLQVALDLMTEHHVSGLPVVGEEKRCLGLISASDILNYEQDHTTQPGDEPDDIAPYYNVDTGEWEEIQVSAFALEKRGSTPVEEIMTLEVISVAADTPIPKVAATMAENEVHRVLVLDNEKTLLGLISAVDFVQLVAESGE